MVAENIAAITATIAATSTIREICSKRKRPCTVVLETHPLEALSAEPLLAIDRCKVQGGTAPDQPGQIIEFPENRSA